MVSLSRRVRFCVNPANPDESAGGGAVSNSFAGWPSMVGFGAFYELEVTCRGPIDESTGYMMNIREIDDAVRSHALPIIGSAVANRPQPSARQVLVDVLRALQPDLKGSVSAIRWHLTPYHSIAMTSADPNEILIRQQFEFAAAHRLHCDDRNEDENVAIFGKCNNPNGHGHNYRLEVGVAVPGESAGGLDLATLERLVDQTIIQKFDHTHLNLDTDDFSGLNPSVENITRVCHALLKDRIAEAGGRLDQVTVWETEKTSCTFPAETRDR